jgi:hypothetical protein
MSVKRLIYQFLVKVLYLFNYKFGFPIYNLPDGGMGSHKHYLKFIINNLDETNLTVVEAGSGDNSTGLFVRELKNKNYTLYSFENNLAWHEKMSKKYKNSNTEFIFIKGNSYLSVEKHLNDLNVTEIDLTFIDSAPWESRTEVKDLIGDISNIVCIHDVDYFPHNNLWGKEISEVKNKPKNKYFYGDLKKENLGSRNYDNEFKFWVEIFPIKPGYFSGPPLLVGSNKFDVRIIFKSNRPKGIYFFSK